MSERWARAMLSTYRWAGAAAYPFVGGYVVWRASRGMEDRGRRRERYGRAGEARPAGPLIWVHAAREGETAAVAALVEHFLSLGVQVLMTTHNVASAQTCRERLGDRVIHQYVPLDMKPALARFLDHWQPDLAVFAESEIWPMTILELKARSIPQVLVSGRMSDRAYAAWRKRAWVAEALFENFSLVVAQSGQDAERFRSLGARPVATGGNLRTDIRPLPVDELELRRMRNEVGDRGVWAAVATRFGEETVAGEVHKLLRNRHSDILTVIVPSRPERGDMVETELVGLGITVARRSRKDKVSSKIEVLIGDVPGEMGLFLRFADIVFLGNSLAEDARGENPLDAAMLDSAVLAGQHIGYYRELYQPLIDAGGLRLVRDRDMLAGAVNFLLKNDKARRDIAAAGAGAVAHMRGALARTARALEPFVHPLVVKSRLEGGPARRQG